MKEKSMQSTRIKLPNQRAQIASINLRMAAQRFYVAGQIMAWDKGQSTEAHSKREFLDRVVQLQKAAIAYAKAMGYAPRRTRTRR